MRLGRTNSARTGTTAAVTISSWLLVAAAVLLVAYTFLAYRDFFAGLSAYGAAVDAGEVAFEGTAFEAGVVVFHLLVVPVKLIIAGTFLLIAVADNRGDVPSRRITLGLAGLLLCCAGPCGGSAALDLPPLRYTGGFPVGRRSAQMMPAWHAPVLDPVCVPLPVVLLAVVILLLLPATSLYFRGSDPRGSPVPPARW